MLIRFHIIMTGLLIVFTGPAIGQQWKPLTSNEKFNFRIDTASYISNSIWADSVKIQNGDSVFFLNRVVTGCDTCSNPDWRLCNQPQFLQKKMIQKPGGIYIFQDPGTYYLKTLAPLNAAWIFDSVAGITAQVINKSYEMIFNIYDSLKTILLSNGDSVRLSKNHGILKFPDFDLGQHYHLEGIEGRNIGIVIPKFSDFFNFKVGDVFQYRSEWRYFGVPPYGEGGLSKITINSRDSSSGYYAYEATVISCHWPEYMGVHGDTSHYYEIQTLVYTDSITHICNYYPHQILENLFDINSIGPNSTYMNMTKGADELVKKYCGESNPYDLNFLFIHGSYMTPPLPFEILVPQFDFVIREYKTGLGLTRDYSMIFESEADYELIGYVKNGDTVGTVYPDYVILESIKENENGSICAVFPNPANDKVIISFKETPKDRVIVEIFSSDGRMVLKKIFENPIEKMETDVHELGKGMYYIKIHSNRNDIVKKLIIH